MGGGLVDDDCEPNGARTVVLLGRTGNGKSATANSILGRKAFKSRASSSGVTSTCELQSTVRDGQMISVIDTPGLFDSSAESDFIVKEIVKCFDLAKDGIHAILVVLSVRTRFSEEEVDALRSLQALFGSKIFDYMIVVFTGVDELEDSDETLGDYLGRDCPDPLKDILSLCKNRCLPFDNKTRDDVQKAEQVQRLLSLVNDVLIQNGGQPYTAETFAEAKKEASELHDQQMQSSYDEQLKRVADMVESKLKESTILVEQRLAEEQAARLKVEESARKAQNESNEEIRELRERLEKAQEEHRMQGEQRLAEEKAARLKVEESAQTAQNKSNEEIRELRERLEKAQGEQRWAEEQAARLKVEESARIAQNKSNEEIRELRERVVQAENRCAIL